MLLLFNKDKNHLNFVFKLDQEDTFSLLQGKVKGMAVPYNQLTDDWRKMSFAKGAFKKLGKTSVYVNHESYDVRSMVGKTEYVDSKEGVLFSASLNTKDSLVNEKLIPLIEMGALDGVSIGAKVKSTEMIYDDDGEVVEIVITEAEIYELSFVTFQAFKDALIESKNKEQDMSKVENKSVEAFNEEEGKPVEEKPVEESTEESENEESTEHEEGETKTEAEPSEESEAEPKDEPSSDEDSEDEKEESEAGEEIEENAEVSTQEMSNEDFKKMIAEKDAEIAKLKQENIDKEKKNKVQKLIEAGIVHKSQEERILKSFASAEAITEFYKDIPASFSVEPKGEGQVDMTSDKIKSEMAKSIASETSLDAEDIEKYGIK